MIYCIINLEKFKGEVFGADDLLEYFPELIIEGITLLKQGDVYYITNPDGDVVSDSAFFTQREMAYLQQVR
tara:strand:- start:1254 stop:1466 length:213 start_codon:yes stop_codon:yes gene_type:complete